MTEMEKKPVKIKWNLHRWLIGLILFAVITVTAAAGTLAYWWDGADLAMVRPGIRPDNSPVVSPGSGMVEETEPLLMLPHKLNVMLLGVDERPKEGDPGRSDTLLVMMVDASTREISAVSVPRDTRVRIRGLGWDKINHAFANGGVALTQQTVENFLGIPMDYYAKVDLESFGRAVDALGGVTVDVEERMYYEDAWDHFVIDLQPGLQRLDGKKALQYVRYRDEDGDIGRVRRQQKFIQAVLAEMNTFAVIVKLPGIIREVFAALDTNMPMPMMLGLARQLKAGLGTGMKVHTVEGLPYYINDISYWVPDVMKTSRKVAEMQGIPFSGHVRETAERMTEDYIRNLPAHAYLDDGNHYSKMDLRQAKPIAAPMPSRQATPVRTTEVQTSPATTPPTAKPTAKATALPTRTDVVPPMTGQRVKP